MSIVDFMFAEQLLMTNCLIKGEYIAFTNSFLCQYSQVYKMLQETSFQIISFSRSQPSSNNKTLNARLLARVITGSHYT